MAFRNHLFHRGVLKETTFDVPVISVGNLAVGGTGKTPHTEYLLRLFRQNDIASAMLSRGYGRATRGFRQARGASASEVGDEPWQVQNSCGFSAVYVCEDRCEGIRQILRQPKRPQVIVLDDAYQHRYVKPGLSILLTDYARLYPDDHVMPEGRLREFPCGAKRAHIIVVTKCPPDLSIAEQEQIRCKLQLLPHQHLFFTHIRYGKLYNPNPEGDWLTHGTQDNAPICELARYHITLLSGIAHPQSLIAYFKQQAPSVDVLSYPDHHRFTEVDIKKISSIASSPSEGTKGQLIITTAKDAARLSSYDLPVSLRSHLLVQPIEIAFLNNEDEKFNHLILSYVTENTRNSSLD